MESRQDDPNIDDQELLWRRIKVSNPNCLKWDEQKNIYRPSSANFKDSRGELSVHIASLTKKEKILENYPDMGIVQITAGLARRLGYKIVHDPTSEDYSHALVCCPENKSKKQMGKDAREIAKAAVWITNPPSHISSSS